MFQSLVNYIAFADVISSASKKKKSYPIFKYQKFYLVFKDKFKCHPIRKAFLDPLSQK